MTVSYTADGQVGDTSFTRALVTYTSFDLPAGSTYPAPLSVLPSYYCTQLQSQFDLQLSQAAGASVVLQGYSNVQQCSVALRFAVNEFVNIRVPYMSLELR